MLKIATLYKNVWNQHFFFHKKLKHWNIQDDYSQKSIEKQKTKFIKIAKNRKKNKKMYEIQKKNERI